MLVAETGIGVTDANSYASQAYADTYFDNRGNAAWAVLTDDQKEQALVRATDYMTQNYRGRWKGYRSNIYQGLDWPRKAVIMTDMAINYMIPFTTMPKEVLTACVELALRASTGALADDLQQNILSESVGPINTVYDKTSAQYTRYRAVDMMLRPLLASTGASTPMVRQ